MGYSYLQRIEPDKNMRRFYELTLQPTLFGEIAVMRHWGRIGSIGQSKEDWFSSEDLAQSSAARLFKQKTKKGYTDLSPERYGPQ